MDIHERIKKIRKESGLSTYDIAKKTGVSQSVISKLENGKRKADSIILEKLSDALNISIDRLTGEAVSSIIENRLEELGMSLETLSKKADVPISWLKGIHAFIPGEMEYMIGEREGKELDWDDEIGGYESYEWITRVANVLNLPGSKLRAALARQEVPLYDGSPNTPEEARTDFADESNGFYITLSSSEKEHMRKYRSVDDKGKHTVDTVLEMEYERSSSSSTGTLQDEAIEVAERVKDKMRAQKVD
ncbi:MAG: helix-turn-helix transcriptional regulator [Anaerovoracaceae bacterium]